MNPKPDLSIRLGTASMDVTGSSAAAHPPGRQEFACLTHCAILALVISRRTNIPTCNGRTNKNCSPGIRSGARHSCRL